jgi:hypothetical protein
MSVQELSAVGGKERSGVGINGQGSIELATFSLSHCSHFLGFPPTSGSMAKSMEASTDWSGCAKSMDASIELSGCAGHPQI